MCPPACFLREWSALRGSDAGGAVGLPRRPNAGGRVGGRRSHARPPEEAPLEPRRVVTLLASATEIVCALDRGDRLVGRSHECDQPPWVKKLPPVTAPRIDTAADSETIERSVRTLVSQALSVYTVDVEKLDALEPDLLVTQVQCEVCEVSLADVEEAVREGREWRPKIVM